MRGTRTLPLRSRPNARMALAALRLDGSALSAHWWCCQALNNQNKNSCSSLIAWNIIVVEEWNNLNNILRPVGQFFCSCHIYKCPGRTFALMNVWIFFFFFYKALKKSFNSVYLTSWFCLFLSVSCEICLLPLCRDSGDPATSQPYFKSNTAIVRRYWCWLPLLASSSVLSLIAALSWYWWLFKLINC